MATTKRTRTEQKARKAARRAARDAATEARRAAHTVVVRTRPLWQRIARSPYHGRNIYRKLRHYGARRRTALRAAVAFALLTWRKIA
jgi:hypothetical protein